MIHVSTTVSIVRYALAIALFVAGVSASVSAQTPSEYVCRGFTVPGVGSGLSMVTTKDGFVWYASKNANRLIRVGKDQRVTPVIPVDAATVQLSGLTLSPDGSIWYSKNTSHRIGRIPADGGKGTEYELAAPNVFTGAIAAAPDGRIWYIDPVANKVGVLSGGGNVTTYDAPTVNGAPLSPAGLAVAADSSVWVTSVGLNAVFRVDPSSGTFTRYDIATPDAQPGAITPGPHGDLWFNMRAVSKIGRITTDGQITEYAASIIGIDTLVAGPDGAMWFSSNQRVGRLDPNSGRVETFACEGGGGMTVGPDRRLWVLGSASSEMFEVRRRSEGTAARVASTSDMRDSGQSPPSGTIETIAADRVGALTRSSSGRVVVQYSSDDSKCGYCVLGNRHYAALAAMGTPADKYVRVLYQPWTSVKDSGEAVRVHLHGLPTIVVFEKGKPAARFEGDASPETMRAKLHL